MDKKIENSRSENESVTHCWLDCDPGHDDSFAILLASFSKKIKLVGLSTITGNQTIDKTTVNALNVMNLYGLVTDVKATKENKQSLESDLKFSDAGSLGGLPFPVIKGCGKPLMRPAKICDEIHGLTGLDTHSSYQFPHLPECAKQYVDKISSQLVHFTSLIYDLLKNSPNRITIIATGPLTNIALLLLNYPDAVNYIEKIVLMGGACGIGNTGPVAEFNIQVDPEAASIVFESGVQIFMVPLEVTHTALVTHEILERINTPSTNLSKILTELLLFFKSTYKDVFFMEQPPLHDPCAIAFVIDPTIFEHRLMRVDIETASHLSYGQTVCDTFNMSVKKKNVHVCLKMNVEKFWNMMIDAVKLANMNSPVNIE